MGKMIAIEQQHHTNYYKFVNMFTDVKHLRATAVRRSYLDFLLSKPKGKKFNENRMYLFLFVRSFVRGRDAFSIILRLVIIALVLMIWLSNPFCFYNNRKLIYVYYLITNVSVLYTTSLWIMASSVAST